MSERRVYLASYWRSDQTSPKSKRGQYGLAAFHWAIVIGPEASEGAQDWVWDVNDAEHVDGKVNKNKLFIPRTRKNADRNSSISMLGLLQIGVMDSRTTYESANAILGSLPVPNKHHQENCVTWATNAIYALQDAGYVSDSLDTETCFQAGARLADKCVKRGMRHIVQKDLTKAASCVVM